MNWPKGAACAVSLSYDDGLPVHREVVAPLLEANGMRGTFYVPIRSDVTENPALWTRVAQAGHELGNHTIFHPCRGQPGFDWVNPAHDLRYYDAHRLRTELDIANRVLKMVDGRDERSYGYTCHHTTFGDGTEEQPMHDILSEMFFAGRGHNVDAALDVTPDFDLLNIGSISADFGVLETLQAHIEQAQAIGGWAVFVMHGIGSDTHNLHIMPDVHQALVEWIGAQGERIWSAPIIDVARHIRAGQ